MFRRCAPLQQLNLYVLCFSDDCPDTGPHPISQEELRAAFNPSDGMECRHPSNRAAFTGIPVNTPMMKLMLKTLAQKRAELR